MQQISSKSSSHHDLAKRPNNNGGQEVTLQERLNTLVGEIITTAFPTASSKPLNDQERFIEIVDRYDALFTLVLNPDTGLPDKGKMSRLQSIVKEQQIEAGHFLSGQNNSYNKPNINNLLGILADMARKNFSDTELAEKTMGEIIPRVLAAKNLANVGLEGCMDKERAVYLSSASTELDPQDKNYVSKEASDKAKRALTLAVLLSNDNLIRELESLERDWYGRSNYQAELFTDSSAIDVKKLVLEAAREIRGSMSRNKQGVSTQAGQATKPKLIVDDEGFSKFKSLFKDTRLDDKTQLGKIDLADLEKNFAKYEEFLQSKPEFIKYLLERHFESQQRNARKNIQVEYRAFQKSEKESGEEAELIESELMQQRKAMKEIAESITVINKKLDEVLRPQYEEKQKETQIKNQEWQNSFHLNDIEAMNQAHLAYKEASTAETQASESLLEAEKTKIQTESLLSEKEEAIKELDAQLQKARNQSESGSSNIETLRNAVVNYAAKKQEIAGFLGTSIRDHITIDEQTTLKRRPSQKGADDRNGLDINNKTRLFTVAQVENSDEAESTDTKHVTGVLMDLEGLGLSVNERLLVSVDSLKEGAEEGCLKLDAGVLAGRGTFGTIEDYRNRFELTFSEIMKPVVKVLQAPASSVLKHGISDSIQKGQLKGKFVSDLDKLHLLPSETSSYDSVERYLDTSALHFNQKDGFVLADTEQFKEYNWKIKEFTAPKEKAFSIKDLEAGDPYGRLLSSFSKINKIATHGINTMSLDGEIVEINQETRRHLVEAASADLIKFFNATQCLDKGVKQVFGQKSLKTEAGQKQALEKWAELSYAKLNGLEILETTFSDSVSVKNIAKPKLRSFLNNEGKIEKRDLVFTIPEKIFNPKIHEMVKAKKKITQPLYNAEMIAKVQEHVAQFNVDDSKLSLAAVNIIGDHVEVTKAKPILVKEPEPVASPHTEVELEAATVVASPVVDKPIKVVETPTVSEEVEIAPVNTTPAEIQTVQPVQTPVSSQDVKKPAEETTVKEPKVATNKDAPLIEAKEPTAPKAPESSVLKSPFSDPIAIKDQFLKQEAELEANKGTPEALYSKWREIFEKFLFKSSVYKAAFNVFGFDTSETNQDLVLARKWVIDTYLGKLRPEIKPSAKYMSKKLRAVNAALKWDQRRANELTLEEASKLFIDNKTAIPAKDRQELLDALKVKFMLCDNEFIRNNLAPNVPARIMNAEAVIENSDYFDYQENFIYNGAFRQDTKDASFLQSTGENLTDYQKDLIDAYLLLEHLDGNIDADPTTWDYPTKTKFALALYRQQSGISRLVDAKRNQGSRRSSKSSKSSKPSKSGKIPFRISKPSSGSQYTLNEINALAKKAAPGRVKSDFSTADDKTARQGHSQLVTVTNVSTRKEAIFRNKNQWSFGEIKSALNEIGIHVVKDGWK